MLFSIVILSPAVNVFCFVAIDVFSSLFASAICLATEPTVFLSPFNVAISAVFVAIESLTSLSL